MNKLVKNVYMAVIWIAVFAACIMIWPVGKVSLQETEQTGIEYNHLTEALSGGVYAVQPFTAKENFLQSIVVMVDKSNMTSDAGMMQLQVLEEDGTLLQTATVPISEISSYADVKFDVNMKVVKGNTYQYSLQALDTEGDGPRGVYRVKSRAGITDLGNLSYFGTAELPDAVSMVRLLYEKPLTVYQILLYDAFFILLGALLTTSKTLCIVFRK